MLVPYQEIDELRTENERLRAEVKRLRRDEARLDHWEKYGLETIRWTKGWVASDEDQSTDPHKTIRSALDAAIKMARKREDG